MNVKKKKYVKNIVIQKIIKQKELCPFNDLCDEIQRDISLIYIFNTITMSKMFFNVLLDGLNNLLANL